MSGWQVQILLKIAALWPLSIATIYLALNVSYFVTMAETFGKFLSGH